MAGETILFVDDEEHIRKLVSMFLERRGYQVHLATNGVEGLRVLRAERIDLLIVDLNMPMMNGLELTRTLRQNPETARIPIIMLSAQKSVDGVLSGYQEAVDEYVAKPVEMAVLGDKVERLLAQQSEQAAAPKVQRRPGHVVVFAHAKGGVGTTTLAINSALALSAIDDRRVALIDLDLEFGNTAVMLDLQPKKTMARFAGVNTAEIEDEVLWQLAASHKSGVQLVAPGPPEEAELVALSTVQDVAGRMRQGVDYLLVDTSASFSERNLAAIDMADVVCVVTTQHLPSISVTKDYLHVLDRLNVPQDRIILIVNRISAEGPEELQIANFFGRELDAVIPYTPAFDQAANAGRPLVEAQPGLPGAVQLRSLAGLIKSRTAAREAAWAAKAPALYTVA